MLPSYLSHDLGYDNTAEYDRRDLLKSDCMFRYDCTQTARFLCTRSTVLIAILYLDYSSEAQLSVLIYHALYQRPTSISSTDTVVPVDALRFLADC